MAALWPPRLEKEDGIAIIAPSSSLGAICPHRLERASKFLESKGYHPAVLPSCLETRPNSMPDLSQCLEDLHEAFRNPKFGAVICAIGGFSANQLLPHLDYDLISRHPKIFCGYSDITLLHHAIQKMAGFVTFYGPAAMTQLGEFPHPAEFTWESFEESCVLPPRQLLLQQSSHWTDEVLD
jgi:muramoyltetrapeptide carboxypeptidase LdcA involved in peptidoglycan recycling